MSLINSNHSNLTLPAPAKLNLFLHITGRRADGYHNLQTLFQFVDYADTLSFSVINDGCLHINDQIPEIDHKDDLIFKAAQLLKAYTQTAWGAEIKITKRLPLGSGLGGGSSNAATTLVGLNKLWDLKLSNEELQTLGLKLGADVPIFIHGKAAWAEGVGEKFSSMENLSEPWYLILVPPCQVSTTKIFSDTELTRDTPSIKIDDFLQGNSRNDFEAVVCKRYPEVARAMQWLKQYAPARMTGTGSCIFAAFADQQQAVAIARQMPNNLTGFVAKGLNCSPLHTKLDNPWGIAKR